MSDNRPYIGVTSKGLNGEDVKSIFPDGTFTIFNSNGKLGMQMAGAPPEAAMSVNTIQAFASLSDAVAWIQIPNTN